MGTPTRSRSTTSRRPTSWSIPWSVPSSIPPEALLATLGPHVLDGKHIGQDAVIGEPPHAVPALHAFGHCETVAPRTDEPIAHVDGGAFGKLRVGQGAHVDQAVGHTGDLLSRPRTASMMGAATS